jgi:hypothetical protein
LNDNAIRAWIKIKVMLGGGGDFGANQDLQFQGNMPG